MDQFAIYLGTDRGFNGGVGNAAQNPRLRTKFDAVACINVALHDAVQDDAGNDHRTLDAAQLAHRQGRPCAQIAFDVAVDVAIEMKSPDKLDITSNARFRA